MHCGYFAVSLDIVYFVFIYFRRKGDETKNCKARRGAAPVALAGRSGARSTEPERGVVGSPHRVAVGVGAASCVRHMRRCRWAPPSRASSYLPLPLVQSRTQCRGRSVQDCRERPEHMYSSQSKVARVPTLTSHQAPTLAAAKEGRCPCRHALWPLVSATNATH